MIKTPIVVRILDAHVVTFHDGSTKMVRKNARGWFVCGAAGRYETADEAIDAAIDCREQEAKREGWL